MNLAIVTLGKNAGVQGGPPLPAGPPYSGAPRWMSQQGHGEIIDEQMENLRKRREEYRQRCGGDPPPGGSGPAYVPVPVPGPAPRPAVPRNVIPRVPGLIPVPVPRVLPFFVIPPGAVCIIMGNCPIEA